MEIWCDKCGDLIAFTRGGSVPGLRFLCPSCMEKTRARGTCVCGGEFDRLSKLPKDGLRGTAYPPGGELFICSKCGKVLH